MRRALDPANYIPEAFKRLRFIGRTADFIDLPDTPDELFDCDLAATMFVGDHIIGYLMFVQDIMSKKGFTTNDYVVTVSNDRGFLEVYVVDDDVKVALKLQGAEL